MPTTTIPYSKTGYFSNMMSDYLEESPVLQPFYGRFPSIVSLKQQLDEKQKMVTQASRFSLVTQLQEQYVGVAISEATQENINSLAQDTTFTITTGHQLNLFSGPLYYVYKILSVINLTEELLAAYPNHRFVPVFWMATEDHDFEEINYFNFKGKKIHWNGPEGGPVGRISTSSLAAVVEVLEKEFGKTTNGLYLTDLFKKAYTDHDTLTEATRYITNELFGSYGMVVLDGDDSKLKKQFIPYVEQELFGQKGFQEITNTTKQLVLAGYAEQVHPREINIFYIQDGLRERIIEKDGSYYVNNTEIVFTEAAIKETLAKHPERFSPNALLRPLYQEVILPNLCYIGGGGEMAYWFQLQDYFKAVSVPFPVLLMRNSALLVPQMLADKLDKLDVSLKHVFKKENELSEWFTHKVSEIVIDFSQQRIHLQEQFAALYTVAENTDASFLGAVGAQEKKQLNGLDHLEKRLLRAQKKRHSDQLDRLIVLRNEIFPKGTLQERNTNFSEYYLEYGTALIPAIKEKLQPLSGTFTAIVL
jgi:bacillithiol biosynthesis cysteine-adding enzyme BshC